MLGGAYSSQYKVIERQHVDTIKTLAENEKADSVARAKKLSVETNKRRRALALKRKSEAEREEKRRQQILAKRRERQQEATEKFQRGHLPSRPSSGTSGRWSPRRNTQLEEALKIVRGNPSTRASSARTQSSPRASYYRQNSDPLSKPYFNKYAHPSINGTNGVVNAKNTQNKQEELHNKSLRNLNNSRNLFEQQLETYQQTLLEQQQKTLREFNKQIMKEIEVNKNVVNNDIVGINGLERSESLSSVDSLEDEGSNDTLQESCDLSGFMEQKNDSGNDMHVNSTKNVTFAGDQKETVKVNGDNSFAVQNGNSTLPSSIDSYSAQVQATQNSSHTSEDKKQEFYLQRQREIQLQLQEQQQQQYLLQQKQQKELQQKVIEQQQKQQQMLQQQYERQRREELEKQRQQELQTQQRQQSAGPAAFSGIERGNDLELNENQRPKIHNKAWATPSPHPPVPATSAVNTTQTYVTHASPYSGKNTHTNMTVPIVSPHGFGSNSSTPINVTSQSSTQTLAASIASNVTKTVERSVSAKTENQQSAANAQEKSLSFLEAVTYGLPVTPDSDAQVSSAPVSKNAGAPNTSAAATKQAAKTTETSAASTKVTSAGAAKAKVTSAASTAAKATSTAAPKPPIHPGYYNSYGAAYAARQQLAGGSTNSSKPVVNETPVNSPTANDMKKTNGAVTWELPEGLRAGQLTMMTADSALNGEDIGDTDSVSTICEDKEPEQKEVKGILKRTGSSKQTGSILKNSGSSGNMKEIRDSLEITRIHLQTSAEEKEQRPVKKNVRFADLCYDDEEPEQNEGPVDERLFVKREGASDKPARPVSAVTAKTISPKIESKPPRASSAGTRTSTIPRAKTQIVRPQAAAHIITQSIQNIDNTILNELDKKVMVVNSNFMEKVPAMARANQTGLSVAPASVYNVSSVAYTQTPQKVNYAVSSIVMPKNESAPFIYPGYNKQGPVPSGSANGPSQMGTSSKYDGAVYDDSGLRIDRTPTDDEINLLWDKLRTCLSRNSNAPSDTGQHDGQMVSSRQAAPVAHTYIDGNALGQYNSLNRVAASPNNPALRRQNSMDNSNNSYTRRYGLLQQRKQQPNPNSLKSRQQQQQQQQQGYTVYQAPVQSQAEPQASGVVQNGADVSESMAGFLAAEQLAAQSVSESRIHQAIDDAQARQVAYNASKPQPKVKSALSVEEQRLMESLERLNDKLKATESTIPNTNPPVSHTAPVQQRQQHVIHRSSFLSADGKVSGFKGHTPLSQRRVIETGNHRAARLRITSATLKRNLHRHE